MRRLGVTAAQLNAAPDISSLLKQANGGLKATLDALRFSVDISAIEFLEKYDSLPERDRMSLPWEAIALSVDVNPAHLLGAATLALQARSASAVKIIALSNHPKITDMRVQMALTPGGYRDRDAIDEALGFKPTSKGITFINNVGKRDDDEGDDEGDGGAIDADLDHLFPSLKQTQETLVPAKARLLETGS
jgi:hypothetical protein